MPSTWGNRRRAASQKAPVVTSAANPHYQKHFDRLFALARAGDWDAVRDYKVTGSNSYSKMVVRYRQDLLAVHAASEPPNEQSRSSRRRRIHTSAPAVDLPYRQGDLECRGRAGKGSLEVQRRRDTCAALRLMRKLLKKQGFAPKLLVTDKLRSYSSAFRHLRLTCPHEQGLRKNNQAENSHQVVRRRSARCNGSNQPDPPSAFSASMPPSTIISMFNATSSHEPRYETSETKPTRSGRMQSQRHDT